MKNYKVKKLYQRTIVSVRNNTIDKCLKKKEGLRIIYENQTMILSFKGPTDKKFQLLKRPFISKYKTGLYYLVDFRWRPNDKSV